MLKDKLARVQDALGSDFGSKIAFVSITTDPERDTPEVLKRYAEAFRGQPRGLGAFSPASGRRFLTWRIATAWPWPRLPTVRSTTPC